MTIQHTSDFGEAQNSCRVNVSRGALRAIFVLLLTMLLGVASAGDLIVGNTIAGTTEYPNGGMLSLQARELDPSSGFVVSCATDPVGNRAFIARAEGDATRIYRISLDTLETEAWADFDPQFGDFGSMKYDSVGGVLIATFRSSTKYGLIRIDPDTLSITGTLEDVGGLLLLRPSARIAYLLTSQGPIFSQVEIVRVDIDTFGQIGEPVAIPIQSTGALRGAALDEANGSAYLAFGFVVLAAAPSLAKIDLDLMALETQSYVNFYFQQAPMALDPDSVTGYFIGGNSLVPFSLADLSRGTPIELYPTISNPITGQISFPINLEYDRASGGLFMGTTSGSILHADLAAGELSLLAGAGPVGSWLTLEAGTPGAYIGSWGGTGMGVFRVETTPALHIDESRIIDPLFGDATFAFSSANNPNEIMAFSSDTPAAFADFPANGSYGLLDRGALAPGEGPVVSGAVDTDTNRVFLGTATSPGRIVEMSLSPLHREAAITLEPGEDNLFCAAIAPERGEAYFGTLTSPARIVRVGLNPLRRIDSIVLGDGDDFARSLVYDAETSSLYAGLFTTPARAVRIPVDTFVADGRIEFPDGEQEITCGLLFADSRRAVFGTGTSPGRILAVDLTTFERAGSLELPAGQEFLRSCAMDEESENGFFLTGLSPQKVVKIRPSPLEIRGSVTPDMEGIASVFALEPNTASLIFPSRVPDTGAVEIAEAKSSYKGSTQGYRVFVPSYMRVDEIHARVHRGGGSIALAIFEEVVDPLGGYPFVKLWESEGTPTGPDDSELVIPISSGEPAALTLLPGSYWLAWQSDSTSEVLGFIPGAPDSGYRRINNEPFDNLQGPYFGDAVHNDEQFSIYLQGRGTSATAQWEMYE